MITHKIILHELKIEDTVTVSLVDIYDYNLQEFSRCVIPIVER